MITAPIERSRSPFIDALRLVLSMWVVFAHLVPWVTAANKHASMPAALAGSMDWLFSVFQTNGETHPAVVGFIVLSGYCIHRSGLRSYRIGVDSYAVRRFFRIYPVFIAAAFFGVGAYLIGDAIRPDSVSYVSGTHGLSVGNFLGKLFAIDAVTPSMFFDSIQGNGPLQTVAVEMWLYAAYPLGLLLVEKLSEWALWVLMIACIAASIAINTYTPEWRAWSYNGSLLAFLPLWWIGAKYTDARFAAVMKRLLIIPVAAWFWLTYMLPSSSGEVVQLLAVLRQLMFALCFAGLVSSLDQLSSGGDNAVSKLGTAGYSIYAFHAPLVYLLCLLGVPWWITVVAVIALGAMFFRIIEQRFIRIGKNIARSVATRREPQTRQTI